MLRNLISEVRFEACACVSGRSVLTSCFANLTKCRELVHFDHFPGEAAKKEAGTPLASGSALDFHGKIRNTALLKINDMFLLRFETRMKA